MNELPSFRGVKFHCEETSNEFGRRLIAHEYPENDQPWVEDMGRRARRFSLLAFVIGDNWEQERDDLIKACEKEGAGVLTHPDYGDFVVKCESCVVLESKIFAGRRANFRLSFVETGLNKFPAPKKQTDLITRERGIFEIRNLADVFTTLNTLSQLPQIAADYVFDQIGEMTGIYNPYSILAAKDALTNLLNGDITLPWQVVPFVTAFTSSFNGDYSESGAELEPSPALAAIVNDPTYDIKQKETKAKNVVEKYQVKDKPFSNRTNSVTPAQALKVYLDIAAVDLKLCGTRCPSKVLQQETGQRYELFIKGAAVCEAAVAASYVEFESIQDAQDINADVETQFTRVLAIAESLNDDKSYQSLRNVLSAFSADLQARAPDLGSIVRRVYSVPTPSLVMAYQFHEDVSRSAEITKRNKIINPAYGRSGLIAFLADA